MKKQKTNLPQISKNTLIIIASVIITAIIVGVLTFTWQQNKVETKIEELKIDKITLTPEYISTLSLDKMNYHNANFNKSQPNTNVTYSDDYIELKIPFNKNWGTGIYQFTEFDKGKNNISFGNISTGGYGWEREYELSFEEYIAADDLIEKIKKEENDFILKPELLTINDKKVIKYETGGMCTYPVMIVIGEKNNYKFSTSCGSGEPDFEIFTNIIKTMEIK